MAATTVEIWDVRTLTPAQARAIGELIVQVWPKPNVTVEDRVFASPDAPVPDLLSTATALHALSSLHTPIDGIREACLDFVDSLWTSQGAFYGTWADDVPDCEYTFYGLLALGHLAV